MFFDMSFSVIVFVYIGSIKANLFKGNSSRQADKKYRLNVSD